MCNFKYYLQYQLGFEDEGSKSALLGTLAHHVLEILSRASIIKHDSNSKIWNWRYLWEICFNHYYNKKSLMAEQIENAKLKKVCQGIENIINSVHTPINDKTISAEISFDIEIPGKEFKIKKNGQQLRVRGRIDRVDKVDHDTIVIYDWKSGSSKIFSGPNKGKDKTGEDLRKEMQPRIYHLAAKQLYPWAKNIYVIFHYFTDCGPVRTCFFDEDIRDTLRMIKSRFKSIESNDSPLQSKSWICRSFCPFGPTKSGICDTVWAEKEELGNKFVQEKYTILNVKKRK